MTAYHVALFIHLLALVAASATSSVVHLAHGRAHRAGNVPELRQWLGLAGATARVFPIATLTLFATGAFMVSVTSPWSWNAGWVIAGMVGVVYLMVSGAVLGARGARGGRALAGLGANDIAAARTALRDPLAAALSWANTGAALGVVFAMAAKPGLPGSLSALVLGAAAGLAFNAVSHRKAAAALAPATARADLAA